MGNPEVGLVESNLHIPEQIHIKALLLKTYRKPIIDTKWGLFKTTGALNGSRPYEVLNLDLLESLCFLKRRQYFFSDSNRLLHENNQGV